jgi:hypothetical protein
MMSENDPSLLVTELAQFGSEMQSMVMWLWQ